MASARILVVDDEYGVRSGIRQILDSEGYEVDDVGTGAEALALLDRNEYDIALLDYRLPDIDGLSILQTISATGLQVMTCMITAYANIDTAIAATRQGVDFFLPKPFLPEDLIAVVATLVRHKQDRSDAERLRKEHAAGLLELLEEKTQTHSLISSLRDAVLVINRDCEAVLANRAMTGLLEVTESQVIRRPVGDLLADTPLASLLEPLLSPQKDRTVSQLTIGDRSFMAGIVTFRTEDGEALGRILTLSDISQVRRLALEKEHFIRTMVHELKSPLGAVRGLIEVASDRSLGDDLDAYMPLFQRAQQRIDGLVQLIGDLLSLSRSEQTAGGSTPELLEIAPAIRKVLDAHQEQFAAHNITAWAEVEPTSPPVLIPPEDFDIILTNLVSNAVKYNCDGGRIVVRAWQDDEWARIDVEDSGIGIGGDNLEQIFAEFFREKRPETRGLEGSGLGLSIVKRLVERAGGSLEVKSEKDVGSTFTILLPA
jgi:two-component system, OmpR family, phosphate regulon sensor histidine kinase PhoR